MSQSNFITNLNSNTTDCLKRILSDCNESYRCEMGIMMALDKPGTTQAKRICNNFKGLETCVPEQTCVGIQGSTYESCIAASRCVQQQGPN